MRFLDLLGMSVSNLKRRKMRTFLTVLGVIIGTASVVIMVSLGIGLNGLMMEQYSSYGNMTMITIYSNAYYSGEADESSFLTDDTIKQISALDHVSSVSPMLRADVVMKQGAYYCSTNITGVTREYLETIPLGQGELAAANDDTLKFYYGNQVIRWFSNEKTGESYWDKGEAMVGINEQEIRILMAERGK